MAKLESYSNLSKLQEDLIKKGFCFGQLFALGVYSKTPHGFNVKSSFKQSVNKDQCFENSALIYFNYKTPNLSLKEQLQTNKIAKWTAEYVPPEYKQVKAKVEVEHDASKNSNKETASVEYSHDQFKAKLAVTNDIAVKISGVAAIKQGGIGADLVFDTTSMRFSGYNAAAFWFADKYRVVLKHISTDKTNYNLGNIAASVFYNWCPKLKLAGLVTHQAKKDLEISLGMQFDTDDNKVIKARLDQNATVGVSVRTKLNQYLTLVTATQFSLCDKDNGHFQFGARIKVNQ